MSDQPLLAVRDLEKRYPITEGLLRREVGSVRAVDGVSFDVRRGETFGLVGESGCGKSTTALSILRLEEPTGGEIRFDGADVRGIEGDALRTYRRRVQFIMQDPDSAFNPRMTVADAVAEPLRVHGMTDANRRHRIVMDVLERVGISPAEADGYPHEFSGGEKQRIALARALVLNPELIVADEPASALDGRTKADVLRLIDDVQAEFDLSILLISHDIDLVSRFCDRVGVMYLGSIVERGPMEEVVVEPRHPYTRALLGAVPRLDRAGSPPETRAATPTDQLPDASDIPSGCRFHPRCPAFIQPEELDLHQEEWIGIGGLRLDLANEWGDREAFLASLEVGDADLDRAVREAYDLPGELSDPRVDAALNDAIRAIEQGELSRAHECLRAVGTSVCERSNPPLNDERTPHPVACHRYDPTEPGEPGVHATK